MHFGVLGAGIVGINCALELQSQFPSAKVSLIAEKFDEDITSLVAAGIFRPGTSFSGPNPEITRQWVEDSYHFYDSILRSPEANAAGVIQVSGYVLSSTSESITKNPILEEILPVYRQASKEELNLSPGDWKYGSFFQTMVIETSAFLPWALKKFTDKGGIVHRCDKISHLHEYLKYTGTKLDCLFNCTGLGAKVICNDHKIAPVRGQVFKVKAPWIKMFYYGDYDTYIIPGRDYVTLGGTRQYDSYNESINPYDSSSIWEKCVQMVPSLKRAKVIKEVVGLRPHRDPVRCELEFVPNESCSNDYLKVIHLYGHGGYGVTTAPGSAKYAVNLLKKSLSGQPLIAKL